MATKQPLNPTASGPRPAPSSDAPGTLPFGTKATTDDGKPEYDPSHFGVYEFAPGEREALIKAKQPHIDPRLLQDTVPPNQPLITKPDAVAMTPRGGFAAPKLGTDTTDRDADTKIAVPRPQASSAPPPKAAEGTVGRDAPTLLAVRAPKASGEAPSAPPVDTSGAQDTLVVPATQGKRDRTRLVAAIVGGAFLLIGVGVARQYAHAPVDNAGTDPDTATPSAAEPQPPQATTPSSVAPVAQSVTPPVPPVLATSARPAEGTRPAKPRPQPSRSNPIPSEPDIAAPSVPKPSPAASVRGKQPWINFP